MTWNPIDSAPKDGTPVDLFISGGDDTVDFYAGKSVRFNQKTRLREGVTKSWAWLTYGPNPATWRCHERPEMMPLSPEVTPLLWRSTANKWARQEANNG